MLKILYAFSSLDSFGKDFWGLSKQLHPRWKVAFIVSQSSLPYTTELMPTLSIYLSGWLSTTWESLIFNWANWNDSPSKWFHILSNKSKQRDKTHHLTLFNCLSNLIVMFKHLPSNSSSRYRSTTYEWSEISRCGISSLLSWNFEYGASNGFHTTVTGNGGKTLVVDVAQLSERCSLSIFFELFVSN